MNIKTLGIDVGRDMGFCFMDDFEVWTTKYKFVTLQHFRSYILAKIDLYNPDIIISCRPTRRHKVIAFQSKLLAIVELCCENRDIQYQEAIDSSCKKEVLGDGTAKKDTIIQWAKKVAQNETLSEHEADAVMFCEFIRGITKL